MTREEAVGIWRRETQEFGGDGPIGALVALGILKLEPKKSSSAFAYNLLDNEGYHASQILDLLDGANLMIVEK